MPKTLESVCLCVWVCVVDVLAMVENDRTVWPAVMIHKTQIWEESNPNRLKTPLVAHSETVTINLTEAEKVEL